MDQRLKKHVCAREQSFSPSVAENIPLQSFRIAFSTDSETAGPEARQKESQIKLKKQKDLEEELRKKQEHLRERNDKVEMLKGKIDDLKNTYRFSQQEMFYKLTSMSSGYR